MTTGPAVDVLTIAGPHVSAADDAVVGVLANHSRTRMDVRDADGDLLLWVDKRAWEDWYARDPDGVAILRIDWSLSRYHAITFADGRTGRFDAAPATGAWELTADDDRHLLVHARRRNRPSLDPLRWVCSQDGSLSLTDFLAAVVTYRTVLWLRRRHVSAIGNL